jgi:hypothetical protein
MKFSSRGEGFPETSWRNLLILKRIVFQAPAADFGNPTAYVMGSSNSGIKFNRAVEERIWQSRRRV